MTQLPLRILPRLEYSPSNFLLHAGIAELFNDLLASLGQGEFRISYVHGRPRTGKTHAGIYLLDRLGSRGIFPRLLDGAELIGVESIEFKSGRSCSIPEEPGPGQFIFFNQIISPGEVVIVDDAHLPLTALRGNDSGPWVSLIEFLRVSRGGLVLLGSLSLDEFSFDDHVRSRLISAQGESIGPPGEADMETLIQNLARQRGMHLSRGKIEFLSKRLRRAVPEIEYYLESVDHLSKILASPIKFPILTSALQVRGE